MFANDLNPESYKYLVQNIRKNKVQDKVEAANLDAMDYIRLTAKGDKCFPSHIIMNLPATAPEFLAALPGSFDKDRWAKTPLPMVHCYSFSKAPDDEGRRHDVTTRAEKHLGHSLPEDAEVTLRHAAC